MPDGVCLPASDVTLAYFCVWLSATCSPDSIKCYLAHVRYLHDTSAFLRGKGFKWVPWAERPAVVRTLGGIKRQLGTPKKRKMPVTFEMLARLRRRIFSSGALFTHMGINGLSLWACMLVGFYGFFRKDNLTIEKEGAFNNRATLKRGDFLFEADRVWIRVRHTKTLQAGERFHWVPLERIRSCPLCPVAALEALFRATDPILRRQHGTKEIGGQFAFQVIAGKKQELRPMTHAFLVDGFKRLAKEAGYDPGAYAGHSFRRGGASAAFDLQAPALLIKAQGDWASSCYEDYCQVSSERKIMLAKHMAAGAAAAMAVPVTKDSALQCK